ncbi:hypothetical protein MIB92_00275 [Aestuariirhabdus sp. Z084]|uniref:hypothetical protein n=1 Tax=Aestuariirhabdus haliotis TaxID=2918751 RepID=UPI00201B43C6|nr:hypothetical protein [Aestuariirhabdus haliotis]MCL6414071.1 hypothetical protein [Aestuariirhabdus haliotis]MCL6418004.1 hypothetical protein [Aestuariirhabdus haliotis]
MNKKIYLISTALLIIGALLSTMSGWRYFFSPVSLFKLGTLLNIVFSIGLGALMAYMLSIRFLSVWKNSVDITMRAKTKHALYIQNSGRWLVYGYYVLFPLLLILMFFGGPVKAEIKFLFFPLLKIFPIGYILFEMARLIDFDARLKKKTNKVI